MSKHAFLEDRPPKKTKQGKLVPIALGMIMTGLLLLGAFLLPNVNLH